MPELDDLALSLALAEVSAQAALACHPLIGRGDEDAADQAAVAAMRERLNALEIDGRVVIGEGERDEAPMLYVGERVGTGSGPAVDIAVDPLEGTTLTAKAMPNAMTVVAAAPGGCLLHAPDVYMEKLAIGPGHPPDAVSLEMAPRERIETLARLKGCAPREVSVCVLERPRHDAIVSELREIGCAIHLIGDGDIAGVIQCTDPDVTGIDMYMGIGGAPEGVLAAAALACLGGQIWGRLTFRNDEERERAAAAGITDLDRIYARGEMVSGDAVFAATGVTPGALVRGVSRCGAALETETLVLRSSAGESRRICCRHPLP